MKPFKACSKIWLERSGQYTFGSGIANILSAIKATGSIKKAAARLGESYRYTWGKIRKVEKVLDAKLVETMVGGKTQKRTNLTKTGQMVLQVYQRFEKDVSEYINRRSKRVYEDILAKIGKGGDKRC